MLAPFLKTAGVFITLKFVAPDEAIFIFLPSISVSATGLSNASLAITFTSKLFPATADCGDWTRKWSSLFGEIAISLVTTGTVLPNSEIDRVTDSAFLSVIVMPAVPPVKEADFNVEGCTWAEPETETLKSLPVSPKSVIRLSCTS